MKILFGIMLGAVLLHPHEVRSAISPDDCVWGHTTNGISAGLFCSNGQLANKKANFEIWLKNSTNVLRVFALPKIPVQFDLVIFDKNGSPVAKTEKGKSLGKKLPKSIDMKYPQGGTLVRIFLESGQPAMMRDQINLFDYFEITQPGKYRVEFEERLLIPLTADSFESVVLPKVMIEIEIK